MEELCEIGHNNCKRIFGVEEYYLGKKCFPSMSLCRSLVFLSPKLDNFMLDVVYMCQDLDEYFWRVISSCFWPLAGVKLKAYYLYYCPYLIFYIAAQSSKWRKLLYK